MIKSTRDVKDQGYLRQTKIVIQGLRDKGHKMCDIVRMGLSDSLVKEMVP